MYAVTIRPVINFIDSARSNLLQNDADSVSEWLTKQAQLSDFGYQLDGVDPTYSDFISEYGILPVSFEEAINDYELPGLTYPDETIALLEAAGVTSAGIDFLGLKDDVYPKSEVYYMPSVDRVCVRLYVNNEICFATFRGSDRHANSSGCGDNYPGSEYNLYND